MTLSQTSPIHSKTTKTFRSFGFIIQLSKSEDIIKTVDHSSTNPGILSCMIFATCPLIIMKTKNPPSLKRWKETIDIHKL